MRKDKNEKVGIGSLRKLWEGKGRGLILMRDVSVDGDCIRSRRCGY